MTRRKVLVDKKVELTVLVEEHESPRVIFRKQAAVSDPYRAFRYPSIDGHNLWYCRVCGDVYPMNPRAKGVEDAARAPGSGMSGRLCPSDGCETLYKLLVPP